MAETQHMPHRLTLEERQKLTVTGVAEVLSFDEASVVLCVGQDTLVIQGQQLQLKQLSPEGGTVSVEGRIGSIVYEQRGGAGSWLSRLFG